MPTTTGAFEIDEGRLTFDTNPPDFEDPADVTKMTRSDNVYLVTIEATDTATLPFPEMIFSFVLLPIGPVHQDTEGDGDERG